MKFRYIFIALTAVFAMASCKSQYELVLNSNDADLKYKTAFEYFDQGKFS